MMQYRRIAASSAAVTRAAQAAAWREPVLRLAAPGESLWDIAKAYGTTTEQILQANELEEEDLPLGRMLLIPSTR